MSSETAPCSHSWWAIDMRTFLLQLPSGESSSYSVSSPLVRPSEASLQRFLEETFALWLRESGEIVGPTLGVPEAHHYVASVSYSVTGGALAFPSGLARSSGFARPSILVL